MIPDLSIRPLRADDVPALAGIFYDSVRKGAAAHYSEEERAAWAPKPPDPADWGRRLDGQTVYVADGGELGPVGFMAMTADGVIDLAYVAPDHMGQGVAIALYDKIEKAARGRGLKKMTTDASHLARRFFLRRGWSVVTIQKVKRGGQVLTNFRMEKPLS